MKIEYATFARLIINQEVYLEALKKIISEIYGVEEHAIAISSQDDAKYNVREYVVTFSGTSADSHSENLEKLRAKDKEIMDALSYKALKSKF